MVCYHPIHGYYSKVKTAKGKFSFTTSPSLGFVDRPLVVPCGQCIGCRLDRSRKWAIRCVHESSLHKNNCFITLTYNNENLPKDNSLNVRDYQLFMKRLRKAFPDVKIRFFHCGEYGEKFQRPHHHACIFGFDFFDKYHYSTRSGVKLYRSPKLEQLWGLGFCTIGDVTFESAAYVARYVTKKINGDKAALHYRIPDSIDYSTGEVRLRKPEFITMSRRPGIAFDWINKFKDDVYPDDFVIIRNGIRVKPPKYYDNIYDSIGGDIDTIKIKRKIVASARKEDNTPERLMVKKDLQLLRANKLKRGFEND